MMRKIEALTPTAEIIRAIPDETACVCGGGLGRMMLENIADRREPSITSESMC